VRRRVFGRAIEATADALDGYELGEIQIGGRRYRALRPGGSARVEGDVCRLTDQDLARADVYETTAYARIEVTLVSGRRAFVYIAAGRA